MEEKQKELENTLNQLKEDKIALEQQRQQYLSNIDNSILELYTRVKKNKKDGIAICKITQDSNGNVCNGCYVYIPGYLIEKVKRKSEIVQCENCGRILTE
jgi:predicted  nucleic acid-binding Zn-ribbon protein